MTRLQAFLLLGVIGFTGWHLWGIWGAACLVATVWMMSPHGPRLG